MGAVELREHELSELHAGNPTHCLVHVDQALVNQLDRDPEGGTGGALADAGLQHPELAALDGELDVAEVLVVALEVTHDAHELLVRLRLELAEVGQRQRVPDAGDDVLALRALQVVAVHADRAGGRVAGERHAGAGVLAGVAEDHRLDVDSSAEVAGDAFLAAVKLGAGGVPGPEHGLDCAHQLRDRLLREVVAVVCVDLLIPLDQKLQVFGGDLDVHGHTAGHHRVLKRVREQLAVDLKDRLAVHLDQAPVGVPREARVAGDRGQAVDGDIVQADVQDRLHHARHAELGTRADRQQQRVLVVAELAAHLLFERGHGGVDLIHQPGRVVTVGQVLTAGLGGDREARRNRDPQLRHLGEVGPLAAEEVLLTLVTFGKCVHQLLGHGAHSARIRPCCAWPSHPNR